jgi:hypothetical protein
MYYLFTFVASLVFFAIWFFKPLFGKTISQFILEEMVMDETDAILLHVVAFVLCFLISLLMPFLIFLTPILILLYFAAKALVNKNYHE